MARKNKAKKAKTDRRIFSYWIELKSVDEGSVRALPVKFFRCVPLVKKGHPMHGTERVEIRVEDGNRSFVGDNFDEVTGKLKTEYPDGRFERFLRMRRDEDAELKRDAALEQLARIVVRAALDRSLDEEQQ